MQKILPFIILCISFCLCNGQHYTDTTVIGHLDNPPLTIKSWLALNDSTCYLLNFVRKGHNEQLVFVDATGGLDRIPECYLEARQLDGKGLPEIIAILKAGDIGASVRWQQTIVHIWNLDTRTEMFADIKAVDLVNFGKRYPPNLPEGISDDARDSIVAVQDSIDDTNDFTCQCNFNFEMVFDKHGSFIIPPFEIKSVPMKNDVNWDCKPLHKPGTYVIKKGVYVLKNK